MRKGVVLRWATTFLVAVALAVVVALFVLEPIVGIFALAGIAVGSATRLLWSREGAPGTAERAPSPSRSVGRIVAFVIGGALIVATIATLATRTLEEPKTPAPQRRPEVVLRAPYVAELSYVDGGRWEGTETLTLDRADVEATLRRRGRGLPDEPLEEVLPAPWRLLRSEHVGEATLDVFGRDAEPVVFNVPGWRPLTASHTIPVPSIRSRRLQAQLVAAEGSRVVLRAPERRVWRTTPASEATPAAYRKDWERREVPLRVGGAAVAGEDVVVEVRSDLARQEFFPQALVGASAWGGLKWAFGILGLGAALSSKVREFLWGWLRRVARSDRKLPPPRGRPRRRRR
jgi:hypothetical protein